MPQIAPICWFFTALIVYLALSSIMAYIFWSEVPYFPIVVKKIGLISPWPLKS